MAATNVQAFSGDVQITSNLAVDTNTLFVDSVGGTVGIGSTLIDITDNTLSGAGNGLYIHNPVENGHLLTLGTQRPWVFEQGLAGASTELNLRSLNSGKHFNFQSVDYSNAMTIIATDGGAGKVGIGTNNPTSMLEVGNGGSASSGSAPGSITVTGTGATKSTGGKPGIYHRAGVGLGLWSDAHMSMEVNGTSGSPLEAMRIKSDGNVGIGTNAPGAPFEVHGPDLAGEAAGTTSLISRHVSGLDGVLNIFGVAAGNGEETLGLQTQIDNRAWATDIAGGWSNGTDSRYNLLLQPYKGNVGIGTTTPTSNLHVFGDIQLNNPEDPDGFGIYDGTHSTFDYYDTLLAKSLRRTADTTFEMQSDGNHAGFSAMDLQFRNIRFYTGTTASPSAVDVNITDLASYERMCIITTGNVGIGITNPTSKLHVVGDIYSTGNITAYSDKRAKENIEKIENALDKVCTLGGYTYTMKGQKYTGLIAQEVLEVLPEAVTGSEETNYALAYGNMMGLIVEAIKELKEKIG